MQNNNIFFATSNLYENQVTVEVEKFYIYVYRMVLELVVVSTLDAGVKP